MNEYEALVVTVGQHEYWGKNMFQLPLGPQKIVHYKDWPGIETGLPLWRAAAWHPLVGFVAYM
jgi:hypothetical protein